MITLKGLTLPHFCDCLNPGPGFPTSIFVFSPFFCLVSEGARRLLLLLILVELFNITVETFFYNYLETTRLQHFVFALFLDIHV